MRAEAIPSHRSGIRICRRPISFMTEETADLIARGRFPYVLSSHNNQIIDQSHTSSRMLKTSASRAGSGQVPFLLAERAR